MNHESGNGSCCRLWISKIRFFSKRMIKNDNRSCCGKIGLDTFIVSSMKAMSFNELHLNRHNLWLNNICYLVDLFSSFYLSNTCWRLIGTEVLVSFHCPSIFNNIETLRLFVTTHKHCHYSTNTGLGRFSITIHILWLWFCNQSLNFNRLY